MQGGGDAPLAVDDAEAGFTVLLEIWHSAMEELVREMPPDQLRVLLIVDSTGKVSLDRIADALGTSASAISRICADMEAAGLLRRCRGVPGSGMILVFVTPSGRRLTARIREQRRAVLDHVLQSLSLVGRESLARGLSELAAGSP